MASKHESLYWVSFCQQYPQLKHCLEIPQQEQVPSDVDQHFDWLLSGLASFKPAQDSSKTALSNPAGLTVRGKKLVQPKLLDATFMLSMLLDLDQIQSHVLLIKYTREAGLMPALKEIPAGQQMVLNNSDYVKAVEFYFQEREYLLKMIQLIQQQGPSHPVSKALLDKLISSGFEDRLFSNLRANIEQQGNQQLPQSAPKLAIGAQPTTSAGTVATTSKVTTSASVELQAELKRMWQSQVLLERCELLSSAMLLYNGSCDGVSCSSHRCLELVRLLATPLSGRRAGATAIDVAAAVAKTKQKQQQQQAGPQLPSAGDEHTVSDLQILTLLAEHLSCTLLLCVMNIPAYLNLIQSTNDLSDNITDHLPLGGKTKDWHAEIASWPGGAPSVMLMITWAAVVYLLEPQLDFGEGASESLQSKALSAGLFDTAALLVELTGLLMLSPISGTCRRVLLESVCAVTTAFELGPTQQSEPDVTKLWELLRLLVQGDASLCEEVWSNGLVKYQPIHALLKNASSLFPAVSSPYLQLLTILSCGPAAAAQAYHHLQASCGLVILHHITEPGLYSAGGSRVITQAPLSWNQAPNNKTFVLPADIEGVVLPLPPAFADKDTSQWALVNWLVSGTHKSFGQLLLLGRAAHILQAMSDSVYTGVIPDYNMLQELTIMLETLSSLVGDNPATVADLLSLTVDQPTASATSDAPPLRNYTWLDATCSATHLLTRAAANAGMRASGASLMHAALILKGLRHAVLLLSSMLEKNTMTVLDCLKVLLGGYSEVGSDWPVSLPLPAAMSSQLIPSSLHAEPPTFLHVALEVQTQDFSATRAILQLLAAFLRREFTKASIPGLVLTCLMHLLQEHTHWRYNTPADRWSLTADIIQVLNLAITAGSGIQGHNLLWSDVGVPPENVHVTGLSAAVLQHLLTHGSILLTGCIPAAAEELEGMQTSELTTPLVLACEAAVTALLRLIPLLLAAARTALGTTPFEERMLMGVSTAAPLPVSILRSFMGYNQVGPALPGSIQLSHLALMYTQSVLACIPHFSPGSAHSMAAQIPTEGSIPTGLQQLISVGAAQHDPQGLLLTLQLLESCALYQPQLLDLLLPVTSATDAQGQQNKGPERRAVTDTSTSGKDNNPPAASSSSPKPPTHSADVLLDLMELGNGYEEVLCAVLRLFVAVMQSPAASVRWASHLRGSDRFWACIQSVIEHNTGDQSDKPSSQFAVSYAWHIVCLEATRHPRLPSGEQATTPPSKVWPVLEKLISKRLVHKALCWHLDSCEQLSQQASKLQDTLLALVLELGAQAVAQNDSGPRSTHAFLSPTRELIEDQIPVAGKIRQELRPVVELLLSHAASGHDVQAVHDTLLGQSLEIPSPASATNFGGDSGQTQAALSPTSLQLLSVLSKSECGSAILNYCFAPGMQLLASSANSAERLSTLIDPLRLTSMIGQSLQSELAAIDVVIQQLTSLRQVCVRMTAQMSTFHSISALASLLLYDTSARKQLIQAASDTNSVASLQPYNHALHVLSAKHILPSQTRFISSWPSGSRISASRLVYDSAWGVACNELFMNASKQSAALLLHSLSITDTSNGSTSQSNTNTSNPTTPAKQMPTGLNLTPIAVTPKTSTIPSVIVTRAPAPLIKVDLEFCSQVVNNLTSWLATSSHTSEAHAAASKQIADQLAQTCTLSLQQQTPVTMSAGLPGHQAGPSSGQLTPATDGNIAAASDQLLLQQQLLAALLPIWSACSKGQLSVGAALQVLVHAVMRYLQPGEWLPLLQSHLNLAALLEMAAAQLSQEQQEDVSSEETTQGEPAGLGVLHLALLAAQVPEGAAWLHASGVMSALSQLAQQLLAAPNSTLAEFTTITLNLHPSVAGQANHVPLIHRPASQISPGHDTAGAYQVENVDRPDAPRAWLPNHQQWCTVLSFSGALIRSVGQQLDVGTDAIDLLRVCEARLLMAVLPPAGNATQPLTLADLYERERALFLLTQLSHYSGLWHMYRPASMIQFRAAAVSFITFAAGINSSRSASITCPPLSAQEKRMATQTTSLPRTEGWLKAAAFGSSETASAPPPSHTPTSPLLLLGLSPAHSLATPTLSPAGGSTSIPTGTLAGASTATTCSEFAARIAEAVYTCLHYALVFLQTTSPQVSDGERNAGLGPGWPRARELAHIQDQCSATWHSIGDSVTAAAPADARKIRVCKLLLKVQQSTCDMIEIVGCSGNRLVHTSKLKDRIPMLEQDLQRGRITVPPRLKDGLSQASSISTAWSEPLTAWAR